MGLRLAAALLFVSSLHGCLTYEFEHEFWIDVDGSGTVHVTARPDLWTAFKALGEAEDPEGTATREAARELFERSGLEVERVTLTRRGGRPYLFVAARFDDVSRLSFTPAFPDLRVSLEHEGGRLVLDGSWQRPLDSPVMEDQDRDGLMAVRFHLPSRVYSHESATEGVERGNILGWRQGVGAGLDGARLELGAVMDEQSILFSTVLLFAGAVCLVGVFLALGLWAAVRRGRRDLEETS